MVRELTRWNPWQDLAELRRWLGDGPRDTFSVREEDEIGTGIAMDVIDKPDEFLVKSAVPGVKPDEIDVSIDDGVLTIKGEHREEQRDERENYLRRELRLGAFHRSFRLPPSVDADKGEAKFEDGMLMLTFPKRAEAKPKKITISPSRMVEGEKKVKV